MRSRSIRACSIRRRCCATARRRSVRSRRRISTAASSARSPPRTALIRSRNIPAVWVATQLRQPTLYQFLQSAGIRDLKPESFYGLALALGGGEVTMEELAGLYAMLATAACCSRFVIEARSKSSATEGVRLLSPEASFITLDMLRRNPRPDDDGTGSVARPLAVAWKTGTSWGFRDAWSAGVVGPYVLVVWIGDFEGRGNPAFVGVDAAAPLFFRIADALNLARPDEAVPPLAPPPGVSKSLCARTAAILPNADCPRTVHTWYIPGKSPIRVSQLHRAVAIDAVTGQPRVRRIRPTRDSKCSSSGRPTCSSCSARPACRAGRRRRCRVARSRIRMEAPRIASPMRNVSYALRRSAPREEIALEASVAADVRNVFWFDGSALIGVQRGRRGCAGVATDHRRRPSGSRRR